MGSPKGAPEEKVDSQSADATACGAAGIGEEVVSEDKKKIEATQNDVTAFRVQCEQACQQDIYGRVVVIVAEGTDVDMRATQSRRMRTSKL